MNENELNRKLHEARLGRCSHPFGPTDTRCPKCGVVYATVMNDPTLRVPDYCSSLDAVAEAEKFVIERVGLAVWYRRLCLEVCPPSDYMDVSHSLTATASALDRAKACLSALAAASALTGETNVE